MRPSIGRTKRRLCDLPALRSVAGPVAAEKHGRAGPHGGRRGREDSIVPQNRRARAGWL